MQWDALVGSLQVLAWVERPEITVRGVQYDSRRVRPGDVFVAMRGESVDGNRFIDSALCRGAAAVITDSAEEYAWLAQEGRATALVERGRRALSEASSALFGHPEKALALSAVTGTNGKTTTAWLLESMLRRAGRRCVLVGTIETHVNGAVCESPHTTPESRDLLRTFADGVELGCTEAVVEASSHALEQERVWGMPVDVAIWTNLTQDHLDFHGTMERYFKAKERLFRGVGTVPPRVAVLNADDPWASERLLGSLPGTQLLRYGLHGKAAEYRAERIVLRAGETCFDWVTPAGTFAVRSPLSGEVNVYNLLAAACAALARGVRMEEIVAAANEMQQVPGRFQLVTSSVTDVAVVVDYAHTDDALRNLITLARQLVTAHGGRVLTVFGCGGDRDRAKRVTMGRVAAEGSDLVIVTSDNPRSEDPQSIIEEVLRGVRATSTDAIVEEDRAGAIAIALRAARPGDVVLIAGKGHEKVQIFADGAVPFDDVMVAAGVLEEMRDA